MYYPKVPFSAGEKNYYQSSISLQGEVPLLFEWPLFSWRHQASGRDLKYVF
jgi:hypothetical protein